MAPRHDRIPANLRQGRRTTAGAGRLRLRQVLVAGEIALATTLVAGAGLLLASFLRLQAVSLGFQPRNVMTARISLPKAQYSRDRAYAFYRDLELELNAVPGVQAAGVASNVPFGGGDSSMSIFSLDDSPVASKQPGQASWRTVTPMNMLYEGLKEKGALMLVPSTVVKSMGMGGLLGAAALRRPQLSEQGGDCSTPASVGGYARWGALGDRVLPVAPPASLWIVCTSTRRIHWGMWESGPMGQHLRIRRFPTHDHKSQSPIGSSSRRLSNRNSARAIAWVDSPSGNAG